MVLPNARSCVSNSMPAHLPSRRWVLPRNQSSRTCSFPAVDLHSSKTGSSCDGVALMAASSKDSSGWAYRCVAEDRDTVTAVEIEVEEKPAAASFSTAISNEESPSPDVQFDSENALTIALLGSGALVALWLASAVVGSIDSIPVFPKLMEVVGLCYTVWFTSRYLIFKKSRDELLVKVDELKQQVLGSKVE